MPPSRVILIAGLVAGALDITAACVVSWLRAGVSPVRVFQSVASGLLGVASYDGGTGTAALGLALHFVIATTWAAVFYYASRTLRFLVEQPVPTGLLYGVIVYLFMNFVVLPLSAFPMRPVTLSGRVIGLLVIMFCIGLPIALIVSRSARPVSVSAPGR
ncbi:MAG TPA: hypothetical protein VGQ69_02365 [Gemmatimonadales bacterium]|jgi:hypothetical protein|nr:hypothetical protein [Gemmatimonadales bacterium]